MSTASNTTQGNPSRLDTAGLREQQIERWLAQSSGQPPFPTLAAGLRFPPKRRIDDLPINILLPYPVWYDERTWNHVLNEKQKPISQRVVAGDEVIDTVKSHLK
jgi:hypothetical protein